MLSGGKRVAYARVPVVDVLYSNNDHERGLNCGKLQTLFMKVSIVLYSPSSFLIFSLPYNRQHFAQLTSRCFENLFLNFLALQNLEG